MGKYLSEVFLETVGTDFSEDSIKRGLTICTKTWKEKGECPIEEMCDLWDAVKDFANEEAFKNDEIIRAARGIYESSRQGIRK